ncbi:MAG TPA: type II toxin-antitoxin system HicB family antitoxin [Streptosporangiaceae bacterium]|jgi:hypothetical protein
MTAALHREEDWYIAQCLEVDVASQGQTIDEALTNLAEAVKLYLEEIDDPAGHVTATPLMTSFRLPGTSCLSCAGRDGTRRQPRTASPAIRPRMGAAPERGDPGQLGSRSEE